MHVLACICSNVWQLSQPAHQMFHSDQTEGRHGPGKPWLPNGFPVCFIVALDVPSRVPAFMGYDEGAYHGIGWLFAPRAYLLG